MPVYEFQCDSNHVTTDLVPIGTARVDCPKCRRAGREAPAERILSATRTDFEFADRRRKVPRG